MSARFFASLRVPGTSGSRADIYTSPTAQPSQTKDDDTGYYDTRWRRCQHHALAHGGHSDDPCCSAVLPAGVYKHTDAKGLPRSCNEQKERSAVTTLPEPYRAKRMKLLQLPLSKETNTPSPDRDPDARRHRRFCRARPATDSRRARARETGGRGTATDPRAQCHHRLPQDTRRASSHGIWTASSAIRTACGSCFQIYNLLSARSRSWCLHAVTRCLRCAVNYTFFILLTRR